MDFQLKVNEQEDIWRVQLTPSEDGQWDVSMQQGEQEQQSHKVRCQRLGPHHLYADIDGRGVHLFVATDKSLKLVSVDGVLYTLEDASKRRKRGGAASGDVTPPMPGTIIRVLVEAGDTVTSGQEVLVMSAMKMETTLYAPADAKVKQVLVGEGEQVAAGQQLFEWEVVSEDAA